MAAFIDAPVEWRSYMEPKLTVWYPKLPGKLEQKVRPGTDPADRPYDKSDWKRLRSIALNYARASVAGRGLPYHNVNHFTQMEAYVDRVARAAGWPLLIRQLLRITALLHDCHHTGATYLQEAKYPAYCSGPTLEWTSAAAAYDLLVDRMPLTHVLFVVQGICCTTYGGNTPKGKKYGVPDVQPARAEGIALRACDLCISPSFEEFIRQSVAVLYGERGAVASPQTWEGFIEGRLGFLGYAKALFQVLDRAAHRDVSRHIGGASLPAFTKQLQPLRGKPSSRDAAMIRRVTAQYGAELT